MAIPLTRSQNHSSSDLILIKLSEEEFWKRYLQSKLYHSHRASIRSVATQHVVNADPIFDQYLEKADDGRSFFFFAGRPPSDPLPELEPRKQRDDAVESLIDLVSTREDHKEVTAFSSLPSGGCSHLAHVDR
jgi:transcription initiation factor TFIIH subunit 1